MLTGRESGRLPVRHMAPTAPQAREIMKRARVSTGLTLGAPRTGGGKPSELTGFRHFWHFAPCAEGRGCHRAVLVTCTEGDSRRTRRPASRLGFGHFCDLAIAVPGQRSRASGAFVGGYRGRGLRRSARRPWRSGPYRLRKRAVEPVFGQIKEARGFRRFLFRGLDNVRCEWGIVCAAHYFGKLAAFRAEESAAAA